MLFDMTIPMSKPIRKRMKTRTMKPKKVVMEDASIVVIVLMSPAFRASSFPSPLSRSRS